VALLSRNAPGFSLVEEQEVSNKVKEASRIIFLIIYLNISL
jgi:hypothetical protein